MLIPFQELKRKYPEFQPKGVVHVGASEGQELEEYHKLGLKKMIWIEAIPSIYEVLVKRTSPFPDVICFNECISDVDGDQITFHVANNGGQSSSFLEFGTHKQMHPDVDYIKDIKMITTRLDTLLNGIDLDYDFLNIDLQGAEGHALRGLGDMINQFKYLYLEVNTTDVYKGCMQLPEMEEFLAQFGFVKKEILFPGNCTWGDCFFVKE
jgi:FkbM family methyltransferase